MRKKQNAVPHCSTEAEVFSSDAGLRMDGIPVSDLSDMVIEVLHSPPSPFSSISTGRPVAMRSQCERHHKFQTKSKISMSEEICLKEIDHVDPWLFDRTNLDTNIQVKYVDTKSQLADIFDHGHFHA